MFASQLVGPCLLLVFLSLGIQFCVPARFSSAAGSLPPRTTLPPKIFESHPVLAAGSCAVHDSLGLSWYSCRLLFVPVRRSGSNCFLLRFCRRAARVCFPAHMTSAPGSRFTPRFRSVLDKRVWKSIFALCDSSFGFLGLILKSLNQRLKFSSSCYTLVVVS
jgi:hypothetical protein